MKRIFGLLILTAFFAVAAFADVPVLTPSPTPAKTVKPESAVSDSTLQISFSRTEKTARLIIPRSQLKQLRAELDALDSGATTNLSGISRMQTIAGGLFLTLAFVFGGVWLARSGKSASKKVKFAAAGAFLFLSGAFGTVVFANIAPARTADITSDLFNAQQFRNPLGLQGEIKLVVTETGDRVRLVVPYAEKEDSK